MLARLAVRTSALEARLRRAAARSNRAGACPCIRCSADSRSPAARARAQSRDPASPDCSGCARTGPRPPAAAGRAPPATTTSTRRRSKRLRRAAAVSFFSAVTRFGRVDCSAGTRPHNSPVTRLARNANPSTRRSGVRFRSIGIARFGSSPISTLTPHHAKTSPRNAAEQRHHHRFHHQLRYQPSAPRANRQPHRDLLLPPRRSRQQQVRHIRARNQQHQPHHDHQHRKRLGKLHAEDKTSRRSPAAPPCGRASALPYPMRVAVCTRGRPSESAATEHSVRRWRHSWSRRASAAPITVSHHQCREFQPRAGGFSVGIIMIGTYRSLTVPTGVP